MGLKDRLNRLEEVRKREEAQLTREALRHLSDEDLYALEDVLEAGQEDGSATFEDLYRVSSEQSRRAVDALLECIEAIREGRDRTSLLNPERRRRGEAATVIASGSTTENDHRMEPQV